MIIPTPQSFLLYFCNSKEARNEKGSATGSKEISNRASYICEILDLFNIECEVHKYLDVYNQTGEDLFYYNIEVQIKAKEETEEGVVFTAHHDIVNVKSDNCQDNSASVINLIDLCSRLKNMDLDRNVHIVFTDSEEVGQRGAMELSRQIKNGDFGDIKYVVNSELTGKGSLIWGESDLPDSDLSKKANELGVYRLSCPLNDSYMFRAMSLESICFGLILEEERGEEMPKTWKICHSKNDMFSIADFDDMRRYVDFLINFI